MKLFVFYLGGRVAKANIELHDVFFAVGKQITDCYPLIKQHWFGDAQRLHIDSYAEITHADGHAVTLTTTPAFDKKLFFVNIGGYVGNNFAEEHIFKFIVASSAENAKVRAKALLATQDIHMLHVDDVIDVAQHIGDYAIALSPSDDHAPLVYEHGYFLLG